MTTITQTPDGPRFDGVPINVIIGLADNYGTPGHGTDAQKTITLQLAAAALRHMSEWQSIETVRKDCLVDILINGETRWCDCYYDQICDQWRTSRPAGYLAFVPARSVTHWRLPPPLPPGPGAAP